LRDFVMGVFVTAVLGMGAFKIFDMQDLEFMRDQNDLIETQQDVLNAIKSNCQDRNWISFGSEVYVCMHVNQMFHRLSNPPVPLFREKSENDA
jgi:hypothetical protein